MINGIGNALHHFQKFLYESRGQTVANTDWWDHHRKIFVRTMSKEKYFVQFKREPFNSYAIIIGDKTGQSYETINVKDFDEARTRGISEFVYVYADGAIYNIGHDMIEEYSSGYKNGSDAIEQFVFPLRTMVRIR